MPRLAFSKWRWSVNLKCRCNWAEFEADGSARKILEEALCLFMCVERIKRACSLKASHTIPNKADPALDWK